MRQYEFDSIGTRWWLEILDDSSSFTPELVSRLRATAEQFDRRYSRFRDDSLVSELYEQGHLSHPPAEMVNMLAFAREMYEVSEGAFDITVGNDLHRMGYGTRRKSHELDTSSFWEQVVVTPAEIILPYHVMLDVGGFGKSWLIDSFVRDMRLAGVEQFIVNGGGDLYVYSDKPVRIRLEDPYDASKFIGSVDIKQGALAASNTIKRVWQDGAAQKHHIIDPRTHDSSQTSAIASYVTARNALVADTMATILILRPELEQTLAKNYGLKTKLINV